ncbi:MAG TPA: response regulator [Gemmataceae bacterium]|jgi:CheY-like chemotaxis protein|nr:response regulator [Gemmataceae bacterium]
MTDDSLLILMAEDDDGHASLVQRNLKRGGVVNRIVHVHDGQVALDYIRRQGAFAGRKADGPLVLLLDINMPRVDGVEVLRQLKADDQTAKIPVIMLTTTDDPREVQRCYELGCAVYVIKPVACDAFIEAIKRLGLFLAIVKVPREDEKI